MQAPADDLPRHVILVDDNPDIRLHVGDLIIQMGYRVETVADPSAVQDRSQWPMACVILLDMRMPDLTGLELQGHLTAVARQVPIVFISGESLPQEIVQAMKAGAVDFLIKPFGSQELAAALDAAFSRGAENRAQEARHEALRRHYRELSPKEREILPLLLQGYSNKALGEQLGIQAGTVKKHRSSIYEKFLVGELSELLTLFKGVDHPDWILD